MSVAPSWERRLDLLEQHLLARALATEHDPDPGLREAWRLLHRPGVRVGEVAAQVGWSRRHLTSRFTGELGIGPKQLARLARLDRSRRLAEQGLPLVEVAARTGYADQAHLSREWVELTGRTPRRTLAEAFPILQDENATGR